MLKDHRTVCGMIYPLCNCSCRRLNFPTETQGPLNEALARSSGLQAPPKITSLKPQEAKCKNGAGCFLLQADPQLYGYRINNPCVKLPKLVCTTSFMCLAVVYCFALDCLAFYQKAVKCSSSRPIYSMYKTI